MQPEQNFLTVLLSFAAHAIAFHFIVEAMANMEVRDQPMKVIDLRSDTVSWPTLAMRVSMANAEVGDDVWGDDKLVKVRVISSEKCSSEFNVIFAPSCSICLSFLSSSTER